MMGFRTVFFMVSFHKPNSDFGWLMDLQHGNGIFDRFLNLLPAGNATYRSSIFVTEAIEIIATVVWLHAKKLLKTAQGKARMFGVIVDEADVTTVEVLDERCAKDKYNRYCATGSFVYTPGPTMYDSKLIEKPYTITQEP